MRERDRGGDLPPPAVLVALDELDDAMLQAVIGRAQARLLDRPVAPGSKDGLTVEVVDRAEGFLLATYRALDPGAQRHLCDVAGQLARHGRAHGAQSAPLRSAGLPGAGSGTARWGEAR